MNPTVPLMRGWHPEGQRIGSKPGAMAYVVDSGGSGEPVILLHGIMVSSWAWRHTLSALHPEFRTIAVCQQGFGWSDKPPGHYDVNVLARFTLSVLDELGLESAHFVGNSLGGAVALRIALDHPERVGRLALLAPAVVRLNSVAWLLRLQHRRLGPVYDLVGQREVYRRFLQGMVYGGNPVDDETMDHFMEPLRSGDTVRVSATICRHLVQDAHTLLHQAPLVRHHTLLCWGSKDGLVPIRASKSLLRRLPNVEFHRYPGVGHCPMEERPHEFAVRLIRFLRAARD